MNSIDESYKYTEISEAISFMGNHALEKLFRVELRGLSFELGVVTKISEDKYTIEINREVSK